MGLRSRLLHLHQRQHQRALDASLQAEDVVKEAEEEARQIHHGGITALVAVGSTASTTHDTLACLASASSLAPPTRGMCGRAQAALVSHPDHAGMQTTISSQASVGGPRYRTVWAIRVATKVEAGAAHTLVWHAAPRRPIPRRGFVGAICTLDLRQRRDQLRTFPRRHR